MGQKTAPFQQFFVESCRAFAILVSLLACCDASRARPAPTILILDQGGPGLLAFAGIAVHLRSVINHDVRGPVAVYAESLDLSRFRGESYRAFQQEFLRRKYADVKIGVIVALGPRALDYAISYRSEASLDAAIVFAAVPTAAVNVSGLPPGVVGNTVDASFANSLAAARAIVPNLRSIALVGDPLAQQSFRFHFLKEMDAVRAQVDVLDLTGLPMRDVKAHVANLPADSAVIYTTINIDGEGKAFLPTEALEEIGQVANRPIVVDVERQVGVGGTGGFVVLTELVGTQAGRVTSRILNGESPASIPVTVTNAVRPVFDWRQLRRWNVDEAQLPPGSEIRFRELPFWRQYPWETAGISAALLVQASLIAALILEERRRRRAEAEKQGLVAELMHINRLATAGELTASIAHEVRQPLAAIAASGAAGLNWLRAKTPNLLEIRAALQEIVESSRRADGVISSVLAMFRKNVPPGVVVNLNTVIEQVLALCSQKIDLERTSVEKRLSTSPAPLVMGEPVQLQQLFLNLIMNALEALSRAQSARVLTVSSACYGSDCFVRVQDSGPGIDPKLAGNIFRPFVTSKSDGIGLGLAICKSIVEAHGGEIRLLPALLSGTAFEVRIPAAPSAAS